MADKFIEITSLFFDNVVSQEQDFEMLVDDNSLKVGDSILLMANNRSENFSSFSKKKIAYKKDYQKFGISKQYYTIGLKSFL